ncbi:MAG: hypothetical protein ACI9SJ_001671, partial [Flavobacteriaceae bacterium]
QEKNKIPTPFAVCKIGVGIDYKFTINTVIIIII